MASYQIYWLLGEFSLLLGEKLLQRLLDLPCLLKDLDLDLDLDLYLPWPLKKWEERLLLLDIDLPRPPRLWREGEDLDTGGVLLVGLPRYVPGVGVWARLVME